ncbi:invasion associated locus B family protein [Afipia sp. GAS231]|uniref:invasion associated locus B family protein n=1 Tax=Afipia sp. GAS231 TaxID=1882747 RepID=UPI0008798759|nr:invasion associated locus B family protein [Afipia sp. GAS231]SDP01056.1 Invasion protein IalB, involved in pathogenesis [Afipia sp. GAS231]
MAFACLLATPVIAEETAFPALTYTPWTKFCLSNTCFVGRDGHSIPDCRPVVAVALIERSGDTKKTLRVTLPTRVSREHGVRIIIDQNQAIERPFGSCFANGCNADYDAGAELVDQLKQGRMLVLEAIDKANSPISLTVPLIDFASAYNGPAEEPKVFEEVVSSVEEIRARLERATRAEEERKARCEAR